MSDIDTGIVLIALGSVLILVGAFVLRTRIPRPVHDGDARPGAGVVLGTGALLVQPSEPNLVNWAARWSRWP